MSRMQQANFMRNRIIENFDCLTQRAQDYIENGGTPKGGMGYDRSRDCHKIQEQLWNQKIWCDVFISDEGASLIAKDSIHLAKAKAEISSHGIRIASARVSNV